MQILKSIQQGIYDLKTEIISLKQKNKNLGNIIQSNKNYSNIIKALDQQS